MTTPHPAMNEAFAAALFHPDVVARKRSPNEEIVEDAIDAWHETEGVSPALHDWLGWSVDEMSLYMLDSTQIPGSYPAEELILRLAAAKTEFGDTVARAKLWDNMTGNRGAIMRILADPDQTPEGRKNALTALTGCEKTTDLLMRLARERDQA